MERITWQKDDDGMVIATYQAPGSIFAVTLSLMESDEQNPVRFNLGIVGTVKNHGEVLDRMIVLGPYVTFRSCDHLYDGNNIAGCLKDMAYAFTGVSL